VRRGVDVHPHKGFETVTIVYEGELEHRDSSGSAGRISTGDVQWMTAGAGLVHEEKHSQAFTEQGGTLEMIQLWVNLPAKFKNTPPKYQEILAAHIPSVPLSENGAYARVIAGNLNNHTGPAFTFTEMLMLDIRAKAGDTVEIPVTTGFNSLIYLLKGKIQTQEGKIARESEITKFRKEGDAIKFEVLEDAKILLLAGAPILEPIASYGPFVMNTKLEIQQAIADFQAGKMGFLD
jgi:redox-sensitive bicupin YhaK (pirin superfamily)